MALNLIVKGNKYEASKAAEDRGIPFWFTQETKAGETIGRCGDEHFDAVVKWYAEPGAAPYPAGALLVWSEIK